MILQLFCQTWILLSLYLIMPRETLFHDFAILFSKYERFAGMKYVEPIPCCKMLSVLVARTK